MTYVSCQQNYNAIKTLPGLGVEVVVLQPGKLDLTSTAGKLMLVILAAVAKMERNLIVERTQAGLRPRQGRRQDARQPPKTTPEQREAMAQGYANKQSVSALAKL